MSEKTIKSIDELLQMFVSTDEYRPKFMKPWRERNHVFASETHILIRANGYLTTVDYPQHNSDNTNKMFPTGIPNGILTAATLENAISHAPLVDEYERTGKDVECEECDGTGEVIWDYKCWSKSFDCPVCDGTGYTETQMVKATGQKAINPDAAIQIGLIVFRAVFLKQILDAMEYCGCKEVSVTFGSRTTATRFNLTDEIDIILMPVNQDKPYTEIQLQSFPQKLKII